MTEREEVAIKFFKNEEEEQDDQMVEETSNHPDELPSVDFDPEPVEPVANVPAEETSVLETIAENDAPNLDENLENNTEIDLTTDVSALANDIVIDDETPSTSASLSTDSLMKKPVESAKLIALKSLANIGVPRLSGGLGMIIDLESNEVMTKPKTGTDVLMERFFVHTSGQSAVPIALNTVETEIFDPKIGAMQTHKMNVNASHPKASVGFLKTQDELRQKILESRKAMIAKRLDEQKAIAGQNADDLDNDDEEELDDEESDEEIADYDDDDNEAFDDEENCDNEEEDDENVDNNGFVDFEADESDSENVDGADTTSKKIQKNESAVTNTQRLLFTQPSANSKTVSNYDSDVEANNSEEEISQENENPCNTSANLFTQNPNNGDDIDESQLEALCSGAFVTQAPEVIHIDLFLLMI